MTDETIFYLFFPTGKKIDGRRRRTRRFTDTAGLLQHI